MKTGFFKRLWVSACLEYEMDRAYEGTSFEPKNRPKPTKLGYCLLILMGLALTEIEAGLHWIDDNILDRLSGWNWRL